MSGREIQPPAKPAPLPPEPQPIPTVPPATTPEIDKSGPIRRFSDQNIQAQIDRALDTLPPGKSWAVVAYANRDEMRVAFMGRPNGHIEWTVAADKPWAGGMETLKVEGAIRISG